MNENEIYLYFLYKFLAMVCFFVIYMNEREREKSMMIEPLGQTSQAASQRACHGP